MGIEKVGSVPTNVPPVEGVEVPTSGKFTPEQTVQELDRIFSDSGIMKYPLRYPLQTVRLPVSRETAINASLSPEARLKALDTVAERARRRL